MPSKYEMHALPHPGLPFIYHPRFALSGSQTSAANWHENIELLQATEGEGYVLCGAERLPLTSGKVVTVNADVLHSIGTETRVVYRCLIIDNSFFTANAVPIEKLHFQSLLEDQSICGLLETIDRAYSQLDPEDYRSILAVRTPILNLVQLLCSNYAVQKPAAPADESVKRALVLLRKNPGASLSLDDLATAVGVSKFHLSRRFRQLTGKTVVQMRNLMRCQEAKGLMEQGMSVSAAAISCGFDNLSYFSRAYQKCMGVLPSAETNRKETK